MSKKEKLAEAYHNSPVLQDSYLAGYNECEKTVKSELIEKVLETIEAYCNNLHSWQEINIHDIITQIKAI